MKNGDVRRLNGRAGTVRKVRREGRHPRRRVSAEAKREGRKLLRLLIREERWRVSWALGASVLGAVFEGFGLGLLIPLLKGVIDEGAEPIRLGIDWVDTWVLAADQSPDYRLFYVSSLILISIIARTALAFSARTATITAIERGLHRIRQMVFDRLLATALPFYLRRRAGNLLNNVTTEVHRLRGLVQAMANLATRGIIFLGYLVFALIVAWPVVVTMLLMGGVMTWVLSPIVMKARQRGRAIARANGALTSVIAEFLSGVRTVFAFNGEGYERRRFEEGSLQVRRIAIDLGIKSATVRPLTEAITSTIMVVLVVASVQLLVQPGHLSPEKFFVVIVALMRMFPLIRELNSQFSLMIVGAGAWEIVSETLSPRGKPALTEGDRVPGPLREGLRFEDVTFAYGEDAPVLQDINLTIHRGETVAFVGASGAGKSTLVDLIPRFHDPTGGRVLFDGSDLREFQLTALRGKMAVVSQDTFLFHDTVAANIAYGLDDVPMERIRWAAEQANALAFIESLPEGFETILGERGARFSGGQRQRIAIARALLRDPEILILDEATSALDSLAEQQVQQSLERLMEGRTAIVIAHRLSTVESADRVVVLEAGRIVEEGTYRELVVRRGKLWEFHVLQTQARSQEAAEVAAAA